MKESSPFFRENSNQWELKNSFFLPQSEAEYTCERKISPAGAFHTILYTLFSN
jgi:hypothetical protein